MGTNRFSRALALVRKVVLVNGYSGVTTFCKVKSASSSCEIALQIAAEEGFTGLVNSNSRDGKDETSAIAEGLEKCEKEELLKIDQEGRCAITDHDNFDIGLENLCKLGTFLSSSSGNDEKMTKTDMDVASAATLVAAHSNGSNDRSSSSHNGEFLAEDNFLGLCSREWLARGGQLLKRTRKGDLHWKIISVYINRVNKVRSLSCVSDFL